MLNRPRTRDNNGPNPDPTDHIKCWSEPVWVFKWVLGPTVQVDPWRSLICIIIGLLARLFGSWLAGQTITTINVWLIGTLRFSSDILLSQNAHIWENLWTKWTKCIYIMLFVVWLTTQSDLQHKPSHTFMHWWQKLPSKVPPAHQYRIPFIHTQYLAQDTFVCRL